MQMPQIQISQQNAKVHTNSEHGFMQVRQHRAKMDVKTNPAELGMHTEHAKVYIDQTQAFADANMKHIFRRIEEYAARGYRESLKGIARRAQEGNRMAAIHIESNPFVEFANKGKGQLPNSNIDFIPKYGSVKFQHKPGKTTLSVSPYNVDINVQARMPEFNYSPGKARTYLAQKNQISFSVKGGKLNTSM